jgi:putative ABC transport system permease protein
MHPVQTKDNAMSHLHSDLSLAFRSLLKRPGLSIAVAVALGLGLGINITIFGLLDALLLRPFQFKDHDRIVVLRETVRGSGREEGVSPANFLDWRARTGSLETLVAWQGSDATLTGRDAPERLAGQRVSAGFFDLLGVPPVVGRAFGLEAEQPGNDRIVVIGDGFWRRRFGGDPGIVGRTILLDGEAHVVAGIAPPGFAFPVGAQLWRPLAFSPDRREDRTNRSLTVAGKLTRDGTLATTQAEFELLSRHLEQQHPVANRDRGIQAALLNDAFRESGSSAMVGVLQVGAVMVLLVACANIAGLLLARGLDRQREFSVRAALGATRRSIIRLMLTEAVVLGAVASILAGFFAWGAIEVMRVSIPSDIAHHIEGWNNLRMNPWLLLSMPALAIGLGAAVGLVPALASTRIALSLGLKDGERGLTGGRQRQRGRRFLVAGEIALALALLIAAGLTVAGGVHMANRPGGFDATNLLTVKISLPEQGYGDPAAIRDFADAVRAKWAAEGAVEHAGFTNILPADGWSPAAAFAVEGEPLADPARRPTAGVRVVSPGYFTTMRVPVRGRGFSEFDRENGERVAVISETMARRYFADGDPIGRRLKVEPFGDAWLTVVGVAGDVRMFNWWDGDEDLAAVYAPLRQVSPGRVLRGVLRTRFDASAASEIAIAAVASVDPTLPVSVRTMNEAIAANGIGLTFIASVMGACGAIALLLSAIGIASVMAYDVSQRTQEFGVRMALGATGGDIMALVLRQAGMVILAGVTAGLVLAVALGHGMAAALFGLIPLEGSMFALAGLGIAAISMAAACIPARRAVRVDPAIVIRQP